MIGSLAGELFLRELPDHLIQGVAEGHLRVFGSVVRDASSGQIAGFLQEAAGLAAPSLVNAGLGLPGVLNMAASGGVSVAQLAQGEVIRAGIAHLESAVSVLQMMGIADLVLGVAGIGISVAGFAVMAARIDGVTEAVRGLDHKLETVSLKIDQIQRDAIDMDLSELRSLSKSYEEGWQLADNAAERRWHDVAKAALGFQGRFELRADRILSSDRSRYVEADPLLDAVSLASSLRVVALASCNETRAATDAAADGARSIERLTGGLGLADLSAAVLSKEACQPGTQAWTIAQATANEAARPIARKIRQREAAALTRAAPLSALQDRAIAPRDWLASARLESEAALLFMPVALR